MTPKPAAPTKVLDALLAGANSIFFGDRLLVTDNQSFAKDREMLKKAGLEPLEPAA